MGWGIALTFLKDNWIPLLMGIVLLGCVTRYEVVVLERNHYKAQVSELQKQISTQKTTIADLRKTIIDTDKIAQLQRENVNKAAAEITAKYKDALSKNESLLAKNRDLNDRRIRDDKELAAVRLSLRTVELFNASKESPSTSSGVSAPTTVPGDAKVTTPSGAALDATAVVGSKAGKVVTLADMMVVVNHNDTNHLSCIDQVKAWQSFWHDVEMKYKAAFEVHSP